MSDSAKEPQRGDRPAEPMEPQVGAEGAPGPEAKLAKETPIKLRERFLALASQALAGGVVPRQAGKGSWSARFDRFTERAKKVLVLAQEEAKRFNHNYIGTEHLLLGLVREREGVGGKVLANLGVELDQVRSNVEFIIGRGDRPVTGDISLTPRSKKVMELAVDEARRLNHNYVGTEHLLLGLVREGEGIAAGVLESMGVTMDSVRNEVMNAVEPGQGKPLEEGASPKDNVITCRINSDDLDAIDALVEAGIRSTRSDAASWLIHAGIEANLDLFDKVYATVADIRRLREAAQVLAKELENKRWPSAAPEPPPDKAEKSRDGSGGAEPPAPASA